MGSSAQDMKAARKSTGKRGSVNNAGRLAALTQARPEQTGQASWEGADARWIAALVIHGTLSGMEVSFVLGRTQGAHGVKLYDFNTGERATLWYNQGEDLNAALEQLYYELGGL